MKDLIERDHALAAVALGDTVNQLQAKIRAIPRAPAPDPAAIREAALREALVALRGAGAYGRTPTQKAAATEQYMLDRDAILALIKKEPKE